MDMTDGSIVSVTDYSTPYLSNSSLVTTVNDLVEQLEESVGGTVEQVQTNTSNISTLITNLSAVSSDLSALQDSLGTQVTYQLSGTTLNIVTK
jgi:glycosyltransferase A (GT-A) superfamily protein (DUF2064 family)